MGGCATAKSTLIPGVLVPSLGLPTLAKRSRGGDQGGFINFICFPLFESFVGQFLQSEDVMSQITANKESFQARLSELEKDEGATPPNVPPVPSKGEGSEAG